MKAFHSLVLSSLRLSGDVGDQSRKGRHLQVCVWVGGWGWGGYEDVVVKFTFIHSCCEEC